MVRVLKSMASALGRVFKRRDDDFKAQLLADLGLKN